jgi:hypothetical protein
LQFNSGYGSVATAYGCRAWVNFNGTGTVAIRASGNVTSITDNGTGDYTVNFTTAMPDANYFVSAVQAMDTTSFPGQNFWYLYCAKAMQPFRPQQRVVCIKWRQSRSLSDADPNVNVACISDKEKP